MVHRSLRGHLMSLRLFYVAAMSSRYARLVPVRWLRYSYFPLGGYFPLWLLPVRWLFPVMATSP